MSKQRDRERAERRGFEDALEFGVQDPTKGRPDHMQVAYEKGFARGMRAVKRLNERRSVDAGQRG